MERRPGIACVGNAAWRQKMQERDARPALHCIPDTSDVRRPQLSHAHPSPRPASSAHRCPLRDFENFFMVLNLSLVLNINSGGVLRTNLSGKQRFLVAIGHGRDRIMCLRNITETYPYRRVMSGFKENQSRELRLGLTKTIYTSSRAFG